MTRAASPSTIVTGKVFGPGWPTVNAFQPAYAGKGDGAIIKFVPAAHTSEDVPCR